ncbi:Peptidyl-prolyl cis-trans isomerase CYP26-2-chloroplastic [Striga hermonthica]|uniref:Peptidyl-prolyl cis-trans isomerase n=1 Tax=Striga hermonthica TaxID=68872 RepID=A0A9N7RN35_STRHE|nr:Peptidyl-prolyl cis-trans isomerase CYP26-2-chloroplastic [Striga hermonthica]
MHCSARLLYHHLKPPPNPLLTPNPSPPNNNPILISRRKLVASSPLLPLSIAISGRSRAETIDTENAPPPPTNCPDPANTTREAFLDVSIDGEPVGRIVIGLYDAAVPSGAARFAELVSGAAGLSYRKKEFVKIMPSYVQHGGLISYESRKERNLALVQEFERQRGSSCGTKNVAGSLSIIVRDPTKPPPKVKVVARKGKLEIDEEETRMDPNGTEFVIATKDSPELDESALVVGIVVGGMDVVDRIAQVKTVQDNSSSPYFRVAKLIGDKRAVVAERGFNRPYSKVVVTNCGLITG